MYRKVSGKYTPLHWNRTLYEVHNGVAWWECIPRYSPGIWNSGSVSYPHFPSGKPVWPHIAQFQNRDKDDQTGYFCNNIIFIPPDHEIWRLTWLSNQFQLKLQILKSYFVSTRKRSSCTISILEWAGGTVLGFEILGARCTNSRSWSRWCKRWRKCSFASVGSTNVEILAILWRSFQSCGFDSA